MRTLIKTLFFASDIFAWLLCVFAAAGAIAYPVVGPVYAQMQHSEVSDFSIFIICFALVFMAIGAYIITQRKLLGIVPAVLSILIVWLIKLPIYGAVFFGFVVLATFCISYFLAIIEIRAHA